MRKKLEAHHPTFRLWKQALVLFVFASLTMAVYHNISNAPFLYDDFLMKNTPVVQMDNGQYESKISYLLFFPALKRRVGLLSFAFNFFLQGENPFSFHLTNIIVHLLNGLLLLYFCFAVLKINEVKQPLLISFSGTLLWLLHPVNTQAISYITQRYTSLCSLFFLSALVCYLRARSHQGLKVYMWSALCALSSLLALGCKEIAATLPFFILLIEFLVLRKPCDRARLFWSVLASLALFAGISCVYLISPGLGWYQNYRILAKLLLPVYYLVLLLYVLWFTRPLQKLPGKKTAIVLGVVLLCLGLFFAYSLHVFFERWAQSYRWRGITPWQRILTESRVVVYYISLVFYPALCRLRLDYDFSVSTSLFSPFTTLLSIALIVSALTIAACSLRKRKLLAFSLLWFFGNLAIESTLMPLDLASEHRIYLPAMLPLTLGTGTLIAVAFQKNSKRWKAGAALCYLAIVLFLSVGTYRRNVVWSSPISLWEDNVKKSPEKPRVWASLGQAYLTKALKSKDAKKRRQWLGKAKHALQKTLELAPNQRNSFASAANACNNLGVTYLHLGELDRAMEKFKQALNMNNSSALVHINIALVYMRWKRFKAAMKWLKTGREEDPMEPKLFSALCMWHCSTNNFQAAFQDIKQGLKLYPHDSGFEQMLSSTREKQRRAKQAQKSKNAGVRLFKSSLREDDPKKRNKILFEAQKKFEQALKLYPYLLDTCTDLGMLYYDRGKYQKAVNVLKARIANTVDGVEKSDFLPLYLTGMANWKLGMYFDAQEALLDAVKINDKHAMAQVMLGLSSWGYGKYDQGKTALEKAVTLGLSRCPEIDSKFPEAYEYLASLYLKRNQAKYATVILEAMLRQTPKRRQTRWYAGLAHLQNKQPQKAVDCFNLLLKHSLGSEQAKILVNLGDAYMRLAKKARETEKQKRYREAEKSLLRAIEIDSSLSLAYLNLSALYRSTGKNSQAVEILRRGLQVVQNFRLYYSLGVIQFGQNEFGKALVNFEKTVALKKDYSPALATSGIVYWLSGDFKYGESLMKKAVDRRLDMQTLPKAGARTAEAFNCLASHMIKQGQIDDAIAILEEIRRVRPDLVEACFNLGVACLRQNRQNQAAVYFTECLKLKPGEPQALYNLACAQLNGENYSKAQETLQQAIAISPQASNFHSLLGVTYFKQGDFANASHYLRRAIYLDPGNTMAREYLAKMKEK